MPPKYNPLAVGQPQGIPSSGLLGQDFNTDMRSWDEEMKIQEALRAAELANDQAEVMNPMLQEQARIMNQNNQLILRDRQRDEDYRQALAAAIENEKRQQVETGMAETRQENGLEPGQISPLRNPEDIDTSQVEVPIARSLDLAQKYAADTGNVDELVKLENAKRSARGDRLLTDVELAQFNLEPGATLATLKAQQAQQRIDEIIRQNARRGSQYDRGLDQKDKALEDKDLDREQKGSQFDRKMNQQGDQFKQTLDYKKGRDEITFADEKQAIEYSNALKNALQSEKKSQFDTKVSGIESTRKANNLKPGEGPLADPQLSDEKIDNEKAQQIAESLAWEKGMPKQALQIEKNNAGFANDRPLTPFEQQYFGLPEGSTIATLKGAQAKTRAEISQGNSNISRESLDIRQGRGIKGLNPDQVDKFTAFDDINALSNNTFNRYSSYLSENRLKRWGDLVVNPNSAAARLAGELVVLQRQMALAYNKGALSENDVTTFDPLTKMDPLDTLETVADKISRLREIAAIRRDNLLRNTAGAGYNVENFGGKNVNQVRIPVVNSSSSGSSSSAGNLTPEEIDYKEQYKARRRQEMGIQ